MTLTEVEAPRIIVTCSEKKCDFYEQTVGQRPRMINPDLLQERLLLSGWQRTSILKKDDLVYMPHSTGKTSSLKVSADETGGRFLLGGAQLVFGIKGGESVSQRVRGLVEALGYKREGLVLDGRWEQADLSDSDRVPEKIRLRNTRNYRDSSGISPVISERIFGVKQKERTLDGLLEVNREDGVQVNEFDTVSRFLWQMGYSYAYSKDKSLCRVFQHRDSPFSIEFVEMGYADGSRGMHLEIEYECGGKIDGKTLASACSGITSLAYKIVPPENIIPASYGGHRKTDKAFRRFLASGS